MEALGISYLHVTSPTLDDRASTVGPDAVDLDRMHELCVAMRSKKRALSAEHTAKVDKTAARVEFCVARREHTDAWVAELLAVLKADEATAANESTASTSAAAEAGKTPDSAAGATDEPRVLGLNAEQHRKLRGLLYYRNVSI